MPNPQPAPPTPPDAAQELEAIRRRVLNVVGHELRTPVTTIHGLAAELEHVDSLATVRDVLAPSLLRNAQRLTDLLDDLLVASGITTALPVGQPVAVDLASEASSRWSELSARPLAVDGGGVHVLAPPAGLRRAIAAVLDNAVAYGTDVPAVTVTAAGGMGRLAVRSPGPPIGEEEARLATEPFFRGERAVTMRAGLGVGLSIAMAVAERAGGTLSFSACDGGTITTLTLPLAA